MKLGDGYIESTIAYSLEMFEFSITKVFFFFFKSYNENYNVSEFGVISRCRTKLTHQSFISLRINLQYIKFDYKSSFTHLERETAVF